MDEKELRTSTKTRILIGVIAVVMLGSIIAGYAAIVLGRSSANSATGENTISAEKKAQYEQEYNKSKEAFEAASQADFEKFVPYKSEVVAFNETTANTADLATEDLVVGEGRELTEGDTDYLAYYVGWCPDESVFDSTFDDAKNPTKFARILNVADAGGMIEGWERGVVGMKLGGIREITIPGELAYKDSREICGGTYKPLKFLVMAVANEEPLKTATADYELALNKYTYAQAGYDYDELVMQMIQSQATGETGETGETQSETTEPSE